MLSIIAIAAVALSIPAPAPPPDVAPAPKIELLERLSADHVKVTRVAPEVERVKLTAFKVRAGTPEPEVEQLRQVLQSVVQRRASLVGGGSSSSCRYSDLGLFLPVPFDITRNMQALAIPWQGPGTFAFEGCFAAVPLQKVSCTGSQEGVTVTFGGTYVLFAIGANGAPPYLEFVVENTPTPQDFLSVGPGDGAPPFEYIPPEGDQQLGTSVLVLVQATVPVNDPEPFRVPFVSNIRTRGVTNANVGTGGFIAEIDLFSVGGFTLTPN